MFRYFSQSAAATPAAGGESVEARWYNFLNKFQRPTSTWEQQSIYKVPPGIREFHPEAYEPRVVSIGPYHQGKAHLEAMEEHKHRALRHFLRRVCGGEMGIQYLVEQFEEPEFLQRLYAAYAGGLDSNWADHRLFVYLMVLDGCFLLELLLTASGDSCQNSPTPGCYSVDDPIFGKGSNGHVVLSYMQLDLLMVENQLPLLVLQKLADIAERKDWDINRLVREFYDCDYDGLPAQPDEPLGLHVLDVYRRSRLRGGTYSQWTSPFPAKELSYYGVHFRPNTGIGSSRTACSLRSVDFRKHKERDFLSRVYQHFMGPIFRRVSRHRRAADQLPVVPSLLCAWPFGHRTAEWYVSRAFLYVLTKALTVFFFLTLWWYVPLWSASADLFLPSLTVDETTEPMLLNLMAFERLHLGNQSGGDTGGDCKTEMAVTCYVLLMSSLLRSKRDVAFLREKKVLHCVPDRKDKEVVRLVKRVTEGVVVNHRRRFGVANVDIVDFCRRQPNRARANWYTTYGNDLKSRLTLMLTIYGLVFTVIAAVTSVLSYVLAVKRPTSTCVLRN